MCPAVCETGEWCRTQTCAGVLLFSFILMSFLSSCTKKIGLTWDALKLKSIIVYESDSPKGSYRHRGVVGHVGIIQPPYSKGDNHSCHEYGVGI